MLLAIARATPSRFVGYRVHVLVVCDNAKEKTNYGKDAHFWRAVAAATVANLR